MNVLNSKTDDLNAIEQIGDILDVLLHNNDKNIIDSILSYIITDCDDCKNTIFTENAIVCDCTKKICCNNCAKNIFRECDNCAKKLCCDCIVVKCDFCKYRYCNTCDYNIDWCDYCDCCCCNGDCLECDCCGNDLDAGWCDYCSTFCDCNDN